MVRRKHIFFKLRDDSVPDWNQIFFDGFLSYSVKKHGLVLVHSELTSWKNVLCIMYSAINFISLETNVAYVKLTLLCCKLTS